MLITIRTPFPIIIEVEDLKPDIEISSHNTDDPIDQEYQTNGQYCSKYKRNSFDSSFRNKEGEHSPQSCFFSSDGKCCSDVCGNSGKAFRYHFCSDLSNNGQKSSFDNLNVWVL